jgi:predicted glutamine amidotransferase
MDKKEMIKLLEQKTPYLAHCRYATAGTICESNIHFFEAGDWIIAMNGTISGFKDKKENDTKLIVKMLQLIKPKDVKKFLSFWESRFLLYNRKTNEKIRTGDWHKAYGAFFSKDNVLSESTYNHRIKWKHNQINQPSYSKNYGSYHSSYGTKHNPYGDYQGVNYSSSTKKSNIETKPPAKKESSQYLVWQDPQWVIKTFDEATPNTPTGKGTKLVAVYDNMKRGRKFHFMLGVHAKYLYSGYTNNKFKFFLSNNVSYVISEPDVSGSKIPVEVFEVDLSIYQKITRSLKDYVKVDQFIVATGNEYKEGRLAAMFLYPADKADKILQPSK